MTTVDFAALLKEAQTAGQALPIGDYPFIVDDATGQAASTGSPMIVCKLRVTDGAQAGKKVRNNFVLTVDNPQALNIFFRHMEALGVSRDFFAALGQTDAVTALQHVAQQIKGRQGTMTLGHREWNGQTQNQVTDVKPLSGVPQGVGGMPGVAGPGLPGLGTAGVPGQGVNLPGLPGLPGAAAPTPAPTPTPMPGPAPTPPPTPAPAPPAPTPTPAPAPAPTGGGSAADLMAQLGIQQPAAPAAPDYSKPPRGYEQYAAIWDQLTDEQKVQVHQQAAAQAGTNGQAQAAPAQPAPQAQFVQPQVPQAGPTPMPGPPVSPLG